MRVSFLKRRELLLAAVLGEEGFESFGNRGPRVVLTVVSVGTQARDWSTLSVDASSPPGATQVLIPEKVSILRSAPLTRSQRSTFAAAPRSRLLFGTGHEVRYLRSQANSYQGLKTGDDARLRQFFWEQSAPRQGWLMAQGGGIDGSAGLHYLVRWGKAGEGVARAQGLAAWGKEGVAISRTRSLSVSRYLGRPFFSEIAAIVPHRAEQTELLWEFARSGELERRVRGIDTATILSNGTFLDVPCDLADVEPADVTEDPLPNDDPTQWLFEGRPEVATEPLQVGVGRLLGFRWPEQPESDDLDELADDDGIVCLAPVPGERPAADRLAELLARAFGGTWSPARVGQLLEASGSKKKDLESWLRDEFFKAHCSVFKNRPFVWHVWDGRKDGFAALVNYHRLDEANLGRLTYTYLNAWTERQVAGVRDDEPGAEERLAAARDLQRRLELILKGEPPFDIYVRWKSLAEQPVGWDPDLNDGVRLNVRPFVEAGVLRAKFNVKWDKDRGKNPDGSERFNDLHVSIAEKQAARQGNPT